MYTVRLNLHSQTVIEMYVYIAMYLYVGTRDLLKHGIFRTNDSRLKRKF